MPEQPNAGLPAPIVHQPGLRALTVFDELPARHLTFQVRNEGFSPHLLDSEFAVVDLSDRTPAHGELFLLGYDHPLKEVGYHAAIGQTNYRTRGGVRGWSVSHGFPGSGALCEGPFRSVDFLARKIIGRIVGVYLPTRGPQRQEG